MADQIARSHRKRGRHAGKPKPVTPAIVAEFLLLQLEPGRHAIVLVSKGRKFSVPIAAETENLHLVVATDVEVPLTTVAEEVPASPVVDERGYFDVPQPAMA